MAITNKKQLKETGKTGKDSTMVIPNLPDDKIDALAAAVKRAHSNLIEYRKMLLNVDSAKEVESPKFHYDWSDILLNDSRSFAIEGFRECGKDAIVMRSFPLYCLTFPSNKFRYIVIIMANTTLVNKKMKELQREFLDNELLRSGVVKIIEESADAFEVKLATQESTTVTVRIEGYGKGSSIRGLSWGSSRPDIVIMNDCQDITDAQSNTMLENDWNWFLDDVMFLGKNSRIFMIGNNLGEKCIIERIARAEGHFGFQFTRVPIADGTDEDSNPTWEAMFPMKFIIAEREQYQKEGKLSIWTRNRMCQCVADEDKIFKQEYFQYYDISDMMKIASSCNVYMRIDPSAQVKETSDLSAFVVFGINESNHVFVFDVINKRMKQSEKVDTVFQLCMKWTFANVGVENAKEGIILMQDLRDQMPQRNVFFKLVEIKHMNVAKESRIESLEPRFVSRSVWFPNRATWLPELEQQLLMFSRSGKMTLHDDIIDALAYLGNNTQAPVNAAGDKPGIERVHKFSQYRNSIRTTDVR